MALAQAPAGQDDAAHGGGVEQVHLYSARKEILIRPLLDRFTERTGIEVKLLAGKGDALLRRMQLEGARTQADLFLSVDAGHLHRARQAGLLQAVSGDWQARVPAAYRDEEGFWHGLALRARVIVYDRARVAPAELQGYLELAEPRWRGELCVRSSGNVYNRSLMAAMIARHGVAAAETWARGLVANLARPPQGGDRDQIRAVAAGVCKLALVNTYYLAGMLHAGEEAAAAVALFWPDQADGGVHVNLSGAGISRYARNLAAAEALLAFLLGEEAQTWFSEHNHEYPVVEGLAPSAVLSAWGDFRADTDSLPLLGTHQVEAVRLMDRAGWR